ncbi:MAG: 3-deoxy-7-phosphoheptulonate synthase [Lentisphaeria bacterium]
MIIVLKPHTTEKGIEAVESHIRELGYDPRVIQGVERTVIGAVGDELSHRSLETLRGMEEVDSVIPIQKRYKIASREFHPEPSIVEIGGHKMGKGHFQYIAGPCSVESSEQMHQTAKDLKEAGVHIMRGGAFKPRTSPYDFQGLGQKGLDILQEVKATYDMAIVTEVVGVEHLEATAKVADMLQIGARNCQNYHLLKAAAEVKLPVFLKRGMATRVEEWLAAAEYLMVHGCPDVVLCERGIRTFENATRNTLDISAVALAKQQSHLPVVVDPSHAAGIQALVGPLAKASIAAGADGLMIETHPNPIDALSDAAQQLASGNFKEVMADLQPFLDAAGQSFTQTVL